MRREQLIAFRQLAQSGDDVPSAIVTAIDVRGRAIRVLLGNAFGSPFDEAFAQPQQITVSPGAIAGTLH